ncbi:maleylpyruvate isomerase N-terminal domain-containing protein [Nonomuraea candida]|uniref:maleylpyruvate isomerase N-terminal domain-containing protein n=1 Tax=Nonomuraea candida TaxID=359159 RepID=UPI0006946AEF|nr:maleylpyruvate isomerase N-terminal domain-containing protein [Nonomuraea candida]
MTVLPALQAELASATNQLLATAASLSDADVAAPSLLPGWTRGHVLAHLAQSAGSYVNLLTWAGTGVRTPQYPSGAARAAGIEAGAARPAALLLAEAEEGAARFAAAVRDLPAPAWSARVEGMRPPPHPAWYVLVRRLREIGFHHVDLASGYGPADWPASFVHRELHDCLATWSRAGSTVSEIHLLAPTPEPGPPADPGPRSRPAGPGPRAEPRPGPGPRPRAERNVVARHRGLGDGPVVRGTPRDMLAWLTGRSGGEGVSLLPAGQSSTSAPGGAGLPEPPPWLTRTAPADLPATPPKDYP